MTEFDLSVLFERWARYPAYASLEDELGAVARGSKAMSYFVFPDSEIDSDELYVEVCKIASQLNLLTMRRKALHPEREGPIPHTYLFLLGGDAEAWRIPAFLFAMDVALHCGWSDGTDDFVSRLLGYSEQEIERWREDLRRFHVNGAGTTVLFLMSSNQAANVRTLGYRAIDPKVVSTPITAFYNVHGRVVRRDASGLVPRNHELMRASLDRDFFQVLFGKRLIMDPVVEIAVCPIDQSLSTALNAALRSKLQLLGPTGWH